MRWLISSILICCINLAWAGSALFTYGDFGPQVLAYETIGYQWYQWNSTGDSDPNKRDDITVVVYWDESLNAIKAKYPVDPDLKKDYRYLSFAAALNYLDNTISEYPDASNLIKTRKAVQRLKQ